MRTVYLHIGTHKTGTTAIQAFLSFNRKKLLQQGILFPSSGKPTKSYSGGQHKLAWEIKKDQVYKSTSNEYEKLDQEWDKLQKEIHSSEAKNIIISSEAFSTFSAEKIDLVKKYLSTYKTKIIVYLRRQDSFFESSYCTIVKKGRCWEKIDTFVSKSQEYRGDYYQLLQPWIKSFGKDNLIIKVYEKEQLPDGLINSFIGCIDLHSLDSTQLEYLKPVNVTPNGKAVKVMRALNWLIREKMSKSSYECEKLNLRFFSNPHSLVNKIIQKLPNFIVNEELICLEEKMNIINKFEHSNRKVAQEYLGRKNSQLFYSPLPDSND